MSCFHPLYAVDLGINKDTGKKNIKMMPRRADQSLKQLRLKYGENSVLTLPCGHCVGCTLDYAKEWAVRCQLESLYYPNSSFFITLTYSPEHLPEKLEKKPFQDFIKRIRNDGFKVRYFGCGEVGVDGLRGYNPHYHLMLYGLPLTDLKIIKKTSSGYLFTSDTIGKYWTFGFHSIALSSFETAGYVARYCMKKRLTNQDDGEFILMSKKPGIGERYLVEHMDEIKKYDSIVGKFGNQFLASVPRYFERLCEKFGIDLQFLKDKHLYNAKLLTNHDLNFHHVVNEEELMMIREDRKSHVPDRLVRCL